MSVTAMTVIEENEILRSLLSGVLRACNVPPAETL
jgi:hypothetical protein